MKIRKHNFNMLEPFLAAPIIALVGYGVSLGIQHLFNIDHWTTWLPFYLFSIPFIIFYLIIIPMIIITGIKEKIFIKVPINIHVNQN